MHNCPPTNKAKILKNWLLKLQRLIWMILNILKCLVEAHLGKLYSWRKKS